MNRWLERIGIRSLRGIYRLCKCRYVPAAMRYLSRVRALKSTSNRRSLVIYRVVTGHAEPTRVGGTLSAATSSFYDFLVRIHRMLRQGSRHASTDGASSTNHFERRYRAGCQHVRMRCCRLIWITPLLIYTGILVIIRIGWCNIWTLLLSTNELRYLHRFVSRLVQMLMKWVLAA